MKRKKGAGNRKREPGTRNKEQGTSSTKQHRRGSTQSKKHLHPSLQAPSITDHAQGEQRDSQILGKLVLSLIVDNAHEHDRYNLAGLEDDANGVAQVIETPVREVHPSKRLCCNAQDQTHHDGPPRTTLRPPDSRSCDLQCSSQRMLPRLV